MAAAINDMLEPVRQKLLGMSEIQEILRLVRIMLRARAAACLTMSALRPRHQAYPEEAAAEAKAAAPPKAPSANEAKGGAGGGSAPPIDVARLDIRVGRVLEVAKHPDADSLYVEKIDVGEAAPRTVISGLVKFMPADALQGRDVVVVCNLKPVAMRGIKSEAMVLAASNATHEAVELLEPPPGCAVGERVSFEGTRGAARAAAAPR